MTVCFEDHVCLPCENGKHGTGCDLFWHWQCGQVACYCKVCHER